MHQERLAYPGVLITFSLFFGHTGFNLQNRCQVKQMTSINSNAPRKTCLSRGFNHFFTFFCHTGFNLQYRCQVKQMNSINSNAPRKTCLSRGFNHLFTFFWPYWLKFTIQISGETEINSINSIAPRKTCLSRVFDH